MKVNLKKIGAIVAGATILASSVSFAGLMFGSTQLVDDNGAPVAKVVVGENAAASDGVAAALIASKIVSEAFKTSNFTAQVSGTATCSAGGNATGTCAVSDETVTLEVTVPGAVTAGTATINNLIGDYLDRDLLDRGESQNNYTMSGSDTSDPANPWKNGDNGNLGYNYITMHRVDGTEFTPLKTTTLTDNSAAKTYSEQQDIWFAGNNHYDTTEDDVVGTLDYVTYTIKFKGSSDDLGIPVCTKGDDNDYTVCKDAGENIDDATETHKLQIKFLGEDWIISEMNPPSAPPNVTDENTVVNGGSVKLAKESISGIINQGESLSVDNLKFQLDDLEAHGETTSAIISVLDANDNVLKKDKVIPATTKEFLVQGKTYRLHVFKVAPGYTFGAKWADMSIFSHELELVDDEELDPDSDTNPEWEVFLGWKNKAGSSSQPDPDHLRTIILHADDIEELSSGNDADLLVGDYVSIVQDPVKWKLSYNGLDIDDSDMDSLTFDLETSEKQINDNNGPSDGSMYVGCNITAPYVEVKSSKSGSTFEIDSVDYSGAGPGGSANNDEFIVAVSGADCDGSIGSGLDAGTVFMKESTSNSARWTVTEYSSFGASGPEVGFTAIGDGATSWTEGGLITWADATDSLSGSGTYMGDTGVFGARVSGDYLNWTFGISEKAGTGTSNDFNDLWLFGLETGASASDAHFDLDYTDASGSVLNNDEVRYVYAGIVEDEGTSTSAEEGYISERGSQFESIQKETVRFDMANTLAHAQWFLASVSANATPGTTQLTLKEGETGTVSTVTIKAKSIDEKAVCSGGAGGSPACTPDMSGVSAMVLTDGLNPSASVSGATPYAFSSYSPLVMLDKDAVGVSTVVSVGGDVVNTVTKSILSGSTVDWSATPVMVKEVVAGSKIVVAGQNAADTTKAADEFIKNMTSS